MSDRHRRPTAEDAAASRARLDLLARQLGYPGIGARGAMTAVSRAVGITLATVSDRAHGRRVLTEACAERWAAAILSTRSAGGAP